MRKNSAVGKVARLDGNRVVLDGGETFEIDPGDRRAATWLKVLDELARDGEHAFVQFDPATRRIVTLLLPRAIAVKDVAAQAAGDRHEVELAGSAAVHFVRPSSAEYGELLAALRAARASGRAVLVTETLDTHEIVDVSPAPPRPFVEGAGAQPVRADQPAPAPVDAARAQELYDLAAAPACDASAPAAGCIPFVFPDDGCWARAHEMCRLMIAAGAKPRKVWIDGNLHTLTRNNPQCFVDWGWHVAPTICVRYRFFRAQLMVIDPSL